MVRRSTPARRARSAPLTRSSACRISSTARTRLVGLAMVRIVRRAAFDIGQLLCDMASTVIRTLKSELDKLRSLLMTNPQSPDLWLYFALVFGVIVLPGMDMAY